MVRTESKAAVSSAKRYPCKQCPLRPLPAFRPFEPEEVEFVSTFKRGELAVDRGSTVVVEGSHSAHLYTVLSGWGFRYKLLPDGRRQILNYLLPGDLIGLQAGVMGEMEHSVEALSPMLMCTFERDRLFSLFEKHPGLGFDVTWLAAHEEQMLDEHLLSVGRRSAAERAAYLVAFLDERAEGVRSAVSGSRLIPITQQHVADTLGLSLVHTNKTLRKLAGAGLIAWKEGGCEVLSKKRLLNLAGWEGLPKRPRPLL